MCVAFELEAIRRSNELASVRYSLPMEQPSKVLGKVARRQEREASSP